MWLWGLIADAAFYLIVIVMGVGVIIFGGGFGVALLIIFNNLTCCAR